MQVSKHDPTVWQIAHGVAKQTKSNLKECPAHRSGLRWTKGPPDSQVRTVVSRGCADVHPRRLCGAGADKTDSVVQVSVCVQRQGVHSGTTQTKNTRPTAVGYDGRSCKGRAQHWGHAGGEGAPVVPNAQWLDALSSTLAVSAVWVQSKKFGADKTVVRVSVRAQ